ncbi:PLP-dependent decarboxylase [Ferrovibrio terrae]|uniref:PLP-dependent decarboxylase n=1 Tax=Ferrovibrio terrae TaxID=2594003 RepID=A0A516GW93_9PROT|nr:PLP-dependent decarboxylase [Ferrovibrio terrae]QDO95776.1 PLP-dependent decarboxylase [Ferrovibrio terrae]
MIEQSPDQQSDERTEQETLQDMRVAAEQEFLAFGWQAAEVQLPGSAPDAPSRPGFSHGDFAVMHANPGWMVVALPAKLVLGTLPSASAVRRFVTKCVSFPAQPNGAIIGAARQAMLQAVEEELSMARQAADMLEAKIDDLLSSIDDIHAKSILFSRDD